MIDTIQLMLAQRDSAPAPSLILACGQVGKWNWSEVSQMGAYFSQSNPLVGKRLL